MHLLLWILLLFLSPGTAAHADQQGIVVRQASVLADEIAHVLRKQQLKALQKNMKLGMWGDLTVAVVDDEQDRDRMRMLINSGLQLYTTGLDGEREFEAGLLAVVLTARAGYDPCAFLGVLTTIDSINPDFEGLMVLMNTHLPAADYRETLARKMHGRLDSCVPGVDNAEQFRRVAAKR
jgi:predicted Zn-dependent protease